MSVERRRQRRRNVVGATAVPSTSWLVSETDRQLCSAMSKCSSSHCVINVLVPRFAWGEVQRHRTETTPDQRCGPHISFVDPFVDVQHYEAAAAVLQRVLAGFPPFVMHLRKFEHFAHGGSATAYLVPETEPGDALEKLADVLLALFPQCDNQARKSPTGKLVPHISAAKFRSEKLCLQWLKKTRQTWKPCTVVVRHLYLLHRRGGDPFQVAHAVQLGPGERLAPDFGDDADDADERVARTLLLAGLPRRSTERASLCTFFNECGFDQFACDVELLLNPNGQPRGLVTLQFASAAAARQALAAWRLPASSATDYLADGGAPYVRPLHTMTFPDHQGGTCTLSSSFPDQSFSFTGAHFNQHSSSSFSTSSSSSSWSTSTTWSPSTVPSDHSTMIERPASPLPDLGDYSATLQAGGPIVSMSKLLRWDKNSALIVEIESLDVRCEIDAIRQRYDKGAARWMPHVTLLHPFVAASEPQYEAIVDALRARLAELPSFPMQLRSVGAFPQSSSSQRVYLRADSPLLQQLRSALLTFFPQHPSRPDHLLHLTLGQWPCLPLDEIEASVRLTHTRRANVWISSIVVAHASQRGPFVPRARIPLRPR